MSSQLFVTLYTLYIYPSAHKQLIQHLPIPFREFPCMTVLEIEGIIFITGCQSIARLSKIVRTAECVQRVSWMVHIVSQSAVRTFFEKRAVWNTYFPSIEKKIKKSLGRMFFNGGGGPQPKLYFS